MSKPQSEWLRKVLDNRYQVKKVLGEGAYGVALLCTDRQTTESVVIKITTDMAQDSQQKAAQEAAFMKQFNHPNILKCFGNFLDEKGRFCAVIEYAMGNDLDYFLNNLRDKGQQLSPDRAIRIFVQIIMALDYLHNTTRVIHRDMKPGNLFMFPDDLIKLGDFGISRIVAEGDVAKTCIGTPGYAAAECYAKDGYDFKADVWSAGALFYELLTLNRAYTGKSVQIARAIQRGELPPRPAGVDPRLISLYESMLAHSPNARPSTQDILMEPLVQMACLDLAGVSVDWDGGAKAAEAQSAGLELEVNIRRAEEDARAIMQMVRERMGADTIVEVGDPFLPPAERAKIIEASLVKRLDQTTVTQVRRIFDRYDHTERQRRLAKVSGKERLTPEILRAFESLVVCEAIAW